MTAPSASVKLANSCGMKWSSFTTTYWENMKQLRKVNAPIDTYATKKNPVPGMGYLLNGDLVEPLVKGSH